MRWVSGGVTAPDGFIAAGLNSGIKKSRKPDLALIVSEAPATAAAVFTVNRVQAAPVLITKSRVAKGSARAVVINSGCANCLTGSPGMADALAVSRAVSQALNITEGEVLIGSTGIIGRRLPVEKMVRAVPRLVNRLSVRNHETAAQAILTTDLHAKEAAVEIPAGGGSIRIGGMAKGAGMIAPSMATMLCVITTDAAISPALFDRLLRKAVDESFNRISIDGDMSTNDTVFGLANGSSSVAVSSSGALARRFAQALHAVCERLALMIVQDGEGATKLMEIEVIGARNEREALSCARQVAFSPLVKTMLAGSDPNVGRIAAAAGSSNAKFNSDDLEIIVSGVRTVARGTALDISKSILRKLLNRPEVPVVINLNAGKAHARMVTCDLTAEYIRINAGYAT